MDITKCVEILRARHDLHAGGSAGCDCATRGFLAEFASAPTPGLVADLLSVNHGSETSSSVQSLSAIESSVPMDGEELVSSGAGSSDIASNVTISTTSSASFPATAASVLERVRALPLFELIGVLLSLQSERVQV
jgi:hypothetical protein